MRFVVGWEDKLAEIWYCKLDNYYIFCGYRRYGVKLQKRISKFQSYWASLDAKDELDTANEAQAGDFGRLRFGSWFHLQLMILVKLIVFWILIQGLLRYSFFGGFSSSSSSKLRPSWKNRWASWRRSWRRGCGAVSRLLGFCHTLQRKLTKAGGTQLCIIFTQITPINTFTFTAELFSTLAVKL